MPENIQQLESRHAPATFAPLLPETLRFRVPPAFQEYLARLKARALWLALIVIALAPFLLFWSRLIKDPTDPSHYSHIFVELVLYWIWRREAKKPWYYEFGKKEAKLISMEKLGWEWYHLIWSDSPSVTIEHSKWENLPALAIVRQSGHKLRRKKLLFVYSPEDESMVEEQVIPFMQRRGTLISEGTWYQKS